MEWCERLTSREVQYEQTEVEQGAWPRNKNKRSFAANATSMYRPFHRKLDLFCIAFNVSVYPANPRYSVKQGESEEHRCTAASNTGDTAEQARHDDLPRPQSAVAVAR